MSASAPPLVDAASAVAALGTCQADIDRLDEASLTAGMGRLRELDRQAQAYRVWLAASIARRSDHTLGYDGLARKNGAATPAIYIQKLTGNSIEEATRLARIGQSIVDAQDAGLPEPPATAAAVSGGISLDAADAIRRGLGRPDSAVTARQLASAAEKLVAQASESSVLGGASPEALVKMARQARNELDQEAIERGEKQRSEQRYVRIWQRNGLSGGSWCLPDEDGGVEINVAFKLMLAKTQGGPRFPETNAKGEPIVKTDDEKRTEAATEDTRSPEHVMADGFVQIFHTGLVGNPRIVPGAARAAVRVIVAEQVLAKGEGSALLEESMTAISFGKLGEYLCEGGTIGIVMNHDGTIDVGREQRLFTTRQRAALGVRDGGCRFPGCEKPPSWCEAHHVKGWAKDNGKTDIRNGILLCRYHHMLIHNQGWHIVNETAPDDPQPGGRFWLTPPKARDPEQRRIEMPSQNPLVRAPAVAPRP